MLTINVSTSQPPPRLGWTNRVNTLSLTSGSEPNLKYTRAAGGEIASEQKGKVWSNVSSGTISATTYFFIAHSTEIAQPWTTSLGVPGRCSPHIFFFFSLKANLQRVSLTDRWCINDPTVVSELSLWWCHCQDSQDWPFNQSNRSSWLTFVTPPGEWEPFLFFFLVMPAKYITILTFDLWATDLWLHEKILIIIIKYILLNINKDYSE